MVRRASIHHEMLIMGSASQSEPKDEKSHNESATPAKRTESTTGFVECLRGESGSSHDELWLFRELGGYSGE